MLPKCYQNKILQFFKTAIRLKTGLTIKTKSIKKNVLFEGKLMLTEIKYIFMSASCQSNISILNLIIMNKIMKTKRETILIITQTNENIKTKLLKH